jgi:hypothetical protein
MLSKARRLASFSSGSTLNITQGHDPVPIFKGISGLLLPGILVPVLLKSPTLNPATCSNDCHLSTGIDGPDLLLLNDHDRPPLNERLNSTNPHFPTLLPRDRVLGPWAQPGGAFVNRDSQCNGRSDPSPFKVSVAEIAMGKTYVSPVPLAPPYGLRL